MRTRTVSVVIDNHGRSMTGSRVEGAESRSLLGRQKSGRFKGGVPGRRPSSGGDMEEGCCNKCLADYCGLRNAKMRGRCCCLIFILLLLIAAAGAGYYYVDQYILAKSDGSDDDADDCKHHCNNEVKVVDDQDDDEWKVEEHEEADVNDDGKRGSDKAGHGADFLPAGGVNTDDAADTGFGDRLRQRARRALRGRGR